MKKCNPKKETRKLLKKMYLDEFSKWFLVAALTGLAYMGIQFLSLKTYLPVWFIFLIIFIGPAIRIKWIHHKVCKRVCK